MDNQQPHQPQPPYQQQPAGPSSLGSLAQSSRLDALKPARWILIIVGLLIVGLYVFHFTNAEKEVNDVLRAEGLTSVADKAELNSIKAHLLGKVKLIYFVHISAGAVMILCGIFVFKMPVPATLTGLLIYLAIQGYSAMLMPESIHRGIIIKILIIVGLAKSVQAAFAYSKEQNLSGMQPIGQPPGPGGM